MLEGLVAWVVNTYVGEYFEDLNADQLSVGLLQGEVELENLPMKKDALNFSGYPVEILSGCVGKIKLQIPVYRLYSEPWVIFIEKLYIVIGPVSQIHYDEKKESDLSLQRKRLCLQDHETNCMVAGDKKKESNSYGVYANWKSYSASLLTNVVENIQLRVKEVHIRFEDSSTCKGRQLACGLIIRELTAQSTDENWIPHFIKGDPNDMTWKLAQLQGLSFYWDPNATMCGHLDRQQMMEMMTRQMEPSSSSNDDLKRVEYLLSSVDATARFKRNCSGEALKSPLQPRFVCDIQLERIPIYFSQNQYLDILQWEKSFHCLSMRWSNRKWRPSSSISSCPREWWQYAVSSYIEPLRPKTHVNNWDSLLQQARDIKEYVSLYREYLKAPDLFPVELMTKREDLESKLKLDVLITLRELVMEDISRKKSAMNNKDKGQETQGGFLQWMFPSWVGWSTVPSSTEEDGKKSQDDEQMIDSNEIIIEEELMTVFKTSDDTFLKRDMVFAQLNFNLCRGTFILLQNDLNEETARHLNVNYQLEGKPIIELEFSDVFVKLETRPRARSILFEIKLGGLSLCDKMFQESKFPFIISAQNEDMYYTSTPQLGSAFSFNREKVDNSLQDTNRWLFELVYEKNPQSIQSDYRLMIKTKPLDVVCNLSLLQIIIGIFTQYQADEMTDHESFDVPSAASLHYEQFKEHTKAELQHTWDRMLVGAKKSKKEWYIELEIAAPQILIPEDIFDANTNVVIFVLGDLHVFNTLKPPTSHLSSNSITLDDDDDFYTPCSTPEECIESPIDVPESCKTEELLFNRLYESYTLELQNMQVLISSLKDSWKFAQLRGSSSLHILDRFSINIQLYRRTFLTRDPEWPSLVFVASLPKLTAHISEVKVCAVKACIEDLEAYFHRSTHQDADNLLRKLPEEPLQQKDIGDEEIHSTMKYEGSDSSPIRKNESSFMLMQFSVEQMSLDIQSQSQSVAELQISGVKIRSSHCETSTTLKLTVHSLLVVDALQLYGPDFELLVASHKHVCMDNSSGKLLSSDAIDLSETLSPTFGSQSAFLSGDSALPWAEGEVDDEALIFVEYSITNSNLSEESHNINVKFNNLDIIANQETIIELMGLLKRIKIGSMGKMPLTPSMDARPEVKSEVFLKKNNPNIEIFFNFRLLNVLLLRAMKHGCVGHKLATATLRNAEIKAVIDNSTVISGTLGGVQVQDLVTEGARHRTIISFGKENMLAKQNDSGRDGLPIDNDSSSRNVCEALTFKIINKEISNDDDPMTGEGGAAPSCHLDLFLRMASLYYVHSPHFLFELSCCAVEFKSYLKSLAYSIKSAATEMAKGIVSKSAAFDDFYQNIHRASSGSEDIDLQISCDIFVNSPVIVLPHSSLSAEVFLAHLGHVALSNKVEHSKAMQANQVIDNDLMFVEVSGMSLFYVDLDNDVLGVTNVNDSGMDKSAIIWSSDECLRCPIVHDTTIEIIMQPFQDFVTTVFGLKSAGSNDEQLKTLSFDMRVISPLNVDFTKKHYELMLKLLSSFSNSIASASSNDDSLNDFPMPVSIADELLSDSKTNKLDSRRSSQVPRSPFLLCCCFELPSLNLSLRECMDEKNGLINLLFNEFNIKYEQNSPCDSTLLATLSSLVMEDLHDRSENKSRSIMISSSSKTRVSTRSICPFEPISMSCPDLNRSFCRTAYGLGSPSLPDILCTENVFAQQDGVKYKHGRKAMSKRKRAPSCPNTPPPSPSAHEQESNKKFASENTLVRLFVLFHNEPNNEEPGRCQKTSFVDIDFNSLDIALSLDPWNIIFDFLSAGSTNSEEISVPNFVPTEQVLNKDADMDITTKTVSIQKSELRISVRSLTVVLRKPEYDLVSANISNFHSQFFRKGKDFHLEGNLGSISVIDLTPMGVLYPERLVTRGSESLQFSISRGKDEPKNHRSSTFYIKGNVSSFLYVHTQRLVTEIVTFFQYFYSKVNSTSSKAQNEIISEGHSHFHLMFDFSATCPVIVLPANAFSTNVLVIKPQTIVVNNTISNKVLEQQYDNLLDAPNPETHYLTFGDMLIPCNAQSSGFDNLMPNTAQSSCFDTIRIVFGEVTVYSGSHSSLSIEQPNDSADRTLMFPSYSIKLQDYLLDETFLFSCEVERSICALPSDKASSINVSGLLSSVYVTLDLEQYKLIRSILSFNFGESLEETIYDPCKEIGQFVLLDTNDEVSTSMMFNIKLSNVTLQLVNNQLSAANGRNEMLAKFDFIQSQLTYVLFSNNRKDIDFFSNEIRISDVRFRDCPANKQPNVFTNILLPNKEGTSSNLQAELHYRLNNDLTKISILLNNMRVMGIMDFINTTLNFFRCPLPPPPNAVNSQSELPGQESSMEMKLNITNTEFVVVEDSSILDSNAVIAKGTAVIVWKPDDSEKPLSFNLEQFEMFSCILGIEDETALSIIDPVNICLDLVKKHISPIAKLQKQEDIRTLEVSAVSLYMRFSYYDLVMFLKILDSVKRQFGEATPASSPVLAVNHVKVLSDMGFGVSDCEEAIKACNGNVDDSALWLTMNAIPIAGVTTPDFPMVDGVPTQSTSNWTFFSIELRMDSIGLCIINDCRDANIPVLDCHLADVCVTQKLTGNQEGFGIFNFSVDYYNCSLSGWEPLVEPWKCQLKWRSTESFEESSLKLCLNVTTEDVVNVNLTSACFKLFKMVKDSWTEDYLDRGLSSIQETGFNKSRSQLMPFKLVNRTGCKLEFSTRVLTSNRSLTSNEEYRRQSLNSVDACWTPVENFGNCLFTFGKRVKLRHQDSHQETLHQIVVRVDGWQACLPVSLDRVGTYFRNISPTESYLKSNDRLIFKVKLENNAQKLVTIESSLSICNKLDDVLEVKLECPGLLYGTKEEHIFVTSMETLPVPLPYVHSEMWIRPIDKSLAFTDLPIQWQKVTKPSENAELVRICNSTRRSVKPYRLSVSIKHGNYPIDGDMMQYRDTANYLSSQVPIIPGHIICVFPCLEIHNTLPYELNFIIPSSNFLGRLRQGNKYCVCDVDISKPFSFKMSIENFRTSNVINITSARQGSANLTLRDVSDRILILQLHVVLRTSTALQLVISAPYYLINKTGLPLIFKQDGTQTEAAGQFQEHEIARSMTPFMFSFYDDDASAMCTIRVGRGLHENGLPTWCPRFRLEKGVQVRQLHVSRNDNRPDWVYNIGIEVTGGKGKYKQSNIVTLSPRYKLDNRSKHVLEFCQKFALKDGKNFVLSAMPECSFPFHWPRIDLDNLLCVRIASIPGCHWSGGFSIDSIKSFFVNMRDGNGVPNFLQTEVVFNGATYYVIFTDAEKISPPIRIDNHSEVSVTYYQTNVSEERLKTTIRPHSSVPYALDEPMLHPYITCSAPGGSLSTYNMDIFREGNQLYYENFIYITFTATLNDEMDTARSSSVTSEFMTKLMGQELVLDVPSGTRVLLGRKEAGKRSQLWRMTSNGMLQHEGSSPPCDLNKSHSSNKQPQKLVLDIATLGLQPNEFQALMLRKPDARRHNTQTWRFTPDGRLCCGFSTMYVQVANGSLGLKAGNIAVLGPMPQFTSIMTKTGIPVEQAICRQKLRGGCGVLTVKVVPDGPTRVLKICDLKEKASPSDILSHPLSEPVKENDESKATEFQVNLKLPKGLGLSVINHLNEDLIYIMMHDIMVEICKSSTSVVLDGSFKSIQVDNQIRETEWPVFLYVTPSSKTDNQRHLPALHFALHYTSLRNVQIFKYVIITVKNLTVHLEEFLMLKLLQLLGFSQSSDELEVVGTSSNELQSSLFRHVTNDNRYYFSTLKLDLRQVRLSVHTTDLLPPDIQNLKLKLGLRLFSFEDAAINLDPFLKMHPFETSRFLFESILDHYKQELKSQAAKIFGAVDFLGNPLGLMNDVTDGISEFLHGGNVGGLIKNVAHGLSDSAAKISESLSDGLGSVAIDEKHQMMRKQIRQGSSSNSGGSSSSRNDHLMAGFRGLGIGIIGGFTSIFTETYEGATQEGIQGIFSGLGKGLVGTVAKPAVGLLDLASGAASAVRDTSKKSSRFLQAHRRPPRKVVGHGYLLPRYSLQQAYDQQLLNRLSDNNPSELFIAKQVIRSREDDIQVFVSSEKIYFLNTTSSSNNILFEVPLGNLFKCCYIYTSGSTANETRHYIQLHMKDESLSGSKVPSLRSTKYFSFVESDEYSCRKPQVRCDSGEVAEKAVTQINYAKSSYEERKYTLTDEDDENTVVDCLG